MTYCRSAEEAYAAGCADAVADPPPGQALVNLAYRLTAPHRARADSGTPAAAAR